MDNFEPYNELLAIDTNIPVLLMTAFVLQGHIYQGWQILRMCYCFYCHVQETDEETEEWFKLWRRSTKDQQCCGGHEERVKPRGNVSS